MFGIVIQTNRRHHHNHITLFMLRTKGLVLVVCIHVVFISVK